MDGYGSKHTEPCLEKIVTHTKKQQSLQPATYLQCRLEHALHPSLPSCQPPPQPSPPLTRIHAGVREDAGVQVLRLPGVLHPPPPHRVHQVALHRQLLTAADVTLTLAKEGGGSQPMVARHVIMLR